MSLQPLREHRLVKPQSCDLGARGPDAMNGWKRQSRHNALESAAGTEIDGRATVA
jgi:hypothetical protein